MMCLYWENQNLYGLRGLLFDVFSANKCFLSYTPVRFSYYNRVSVVLSLSNFSLCRLTALLLNQASYSTGVTIEFKNEEECEAFHSAVQQWIKENNVQGAAL